MTTLAAGAAVAQHIAHVLARNGFDVLFGQSPLSALILACGCGRGYAFSVPRRSASESEESLRRCR